MGRVKWVVSFDGMSGFYSVHIGLCSSGTGYFGAAGLGPTKMLVSMWDCEVTGVERRHRGLRG